MKTSQKQYQLVVSQAVLTLFAAVGLLALTPVVAQAGNVGWAVSIGGGYGGGYGGGWRPAAYGPGYGYPYAGYYAPPVVYAAPPVVPMRFHNNP